MIKLTKTAAKGRPALKVDVLGVGIDPLSMSEVVAEIENWVALGSPKRIITANPEIIFRAQRDFELKGLINTADMVTADGVGVVWAAKVLGSPVPGRVTGIDLLSSLFPVANNKGWRVFLLGGSPGVAAEAVAKLGISYPKIAFAESHGYFRAGKEELGVLAKIEKFAPHLLLVGLGAPKQEEWIKRYYRKLLVPVSIGVGGSFDVLAGRVKRVPAWIQKLKLEWLARLLREPRRIKRQLALPKFVLQVLAKKFSKTPKKP